MPAVSQIEQHDHARFPTQVSQIPPNVSTVILGATRLSQLEETLVAADLIPKMTPAVLEEIEAALGTKPEMSEGMQQVVAIRGPPARL